MISDKRKLEFWNFLISEKNQPRPKGITTQRLAVLRPAVLAFDEMWLQVIDPGNSDERSAAEFYGSKEPASVISRTEFWTAVRNLIRHNETKTIEDRPSKSNRRNNHINKAKTQV